MDPRLKKAIEDAKTKKAADDDAARMAEIASIEEKRRLLEAEIATAMPAARKHVEETVIPEVAKAVAKREAKIEVKADGVWRDALIRAINEVVGMTATAQHYRGQYEEGYGDTSYDYIAVYWRDA